MKKSLLLLSLLFIASLSKAQVDCGSSRFDQEVFPNVTITSDIVYGANLDVNGANVILKLDLYEPTGDTMAARPMIVWAHGGSFLAGSKADVDVVSLCQHFAKRGYVCANIDYRLGIPFPINAANATNAVFRATQDMKAAVRFFRQDAATTNTYKIDPTIIYAGGSSAGAFAALHLAYLNEVSELPASIDTVALGGLEGNSGNPGYISTVNAVIDLCGALGNKAWANSNEVPFVAMHGNADGTVPYGTAIIYLLGSFPIMVVDGSSSIAAHADSVGLYNQFYTYFGADHVPYTSNLAYMDTTVRFVSNFLFRNLGCSPADPNPLPNTFTTAIATTNRAMDVSVFPNPASSQITIQLNTAGKNHIQLADLNGRIVVQQIATVQKTVLDITRLTPGVYVVKVLGENGEFVAKKVLVD